jgi:hypothetical protein
MDPPAAIRDCLVARLSISKTMMLAMYLGIQLFQAISQDHCGTAVQRYIGWVDKLENHFATDSGTNPPMTETADLILVQLEVSNFHQPVIRHDKQCMRLACVSEIHYSRYRLWIYHTSKSVTQVSSVSSGR